MREREKTSVGGGVEFWAGVHDINGRISDWICTADCAHILDVRSAFVLHHPALRKWKTKESAERKKMRIFESAPLAVRNVLSMHLWR